MIADRGGGGGRWRDGIRPGRQEGRVGRWGEGEVRHVKGRGRGGEEESVREKEKGRGE